MSLSITRCAPPVAIGANSRVLRVPGMAAPTDQQSPTDRVDVGSMRDGPKVSGIAAASVRAVPSTTARRVAVVARVVYVEARWDGADQRTEDVPMGRVAPPIDHDLRVALAVAAARDRVASIGTAGDVDQSENLGRQRDTLGVHRGLPPWCLGAAAGTARSFSMLSEAGSCL